MPKTDDDKWRRLAEKIVAFCRSNRHDAADLKASVLIALLLRERKNLIGEIEVMLEINVEDSPLLREAININRAQDTLEAYLSAVIDSIEASANAALDGASRDAFSDMTLREIAEFNSLYFGSSAAEREDLLENLRQGRTQHFS